MEKLIWTKDGTVKRVTLTAEEATTLTGYTPPVE